MIPMKEGLLRTTAYISGVRSVTVSEDGDSIRLDSGTPFSPHVTLIFEDPDQLLRFARALADGIARPGESFPIKTTTVGFREADEERAWMRGA